MGRVCRRTSSSPFSPLKTLPTAAIPRSTRLWNSWPQEMNNLRIRREFALSSRSGTRAPFPSHSRGSLMKPIHCVRMLTFLAPLLGALLFVKTLSAQTSAPPSATQAALPSETPAKFQPVTDSFDYTRRDVMILMLDGVKLHTVIIVSTVVKGARMLLNSTAYV